uniref:Uncharacterized protein n=1 Tax=Oryza glumipatula TaxID=40148 RepID=A0A0D9Y6W6_9ORYZ
MNRRFTGRSLVRRASLVPSRADTAPLRATTSIKAGSVSLRQLKVTPTALINNLSDELNIRVTCIVPCPLHASTRVVPFP